MKKTPVLHLILLLLALPLGAQQSYEVLLKSGKVLFEENAPTYTQEAFISAQEAVDGKYYRFLQFYELPDERRIALLRERGIELLEYIPNNVYIASIAEDFDVALFHLLGVRSIVPIVPKVKMSANLQEPLPDWARSGEWVQVMLKHYRNLDQDLVLRFAAMDGIRVLLSNGVNNVVQALVREDRLAATAALPYVEYLELIPPPGEPEDTPGRALHRANAIDTQIPWGRHYTGEGVNVLTRDDGAVGPHIDFQGRLDQSYIDPTSSNQGNHGDGVSGIFVGAGNLNPEYRGMAAGAFLYTLDYEATFLDETMDLFFDHNVIVTNSSYSNGCNAGYTTITQTVDQQIWENPTLLHVFSAGNSNNNDCGYGAGDQWGNITGGHKQGKNVIATANLFNTGVLVNSSSRGPAHDGRIKPDIAANGAEHISTDENNGYFPFGGTSGASPGIAGVTAMLHQAFREHNGGATAPSALLKAILLNTANDLGNRGPDFKFGWGHVNAYRAALTIEGGNWFEAEVAPGDTTIHTIEIPAGVRQARIMVYWADEPASEMAAMALVNDLDAYLMDTSGNRYLPWVLDPTPDPVILNSPAGKGRDSLNNMEQIALDDPEAGIYELHVVGNALPFGNHRYFVTWEFRTEEPTLIYPIGGESLVPGETVRIHWDAEGTDGFFILQWSANGGGNYMPIATAFGQERMYDWTVPNITTGRARFRITRGSFSDTSSLFSIAPVPTGLQVAEGCPDYVRLVWDPVPDATGYDVFMLGDRYMEVVGSTDQTQFDVPISNPFGEKWFAVRMTGPNETIGRRTVAIRFDGGLFNCPLAQDVSVEEIKAPAAGPLSACQSLQEPIVITVKNNGLEPLSPVEVAFQLDNQTPVVEALPDTLQPGQTLDYTFSQPLVINSSGDYTLTSWASIPGGDEFLLNDTTSINLSLNLFPGIGEPLDYSEDFEGPTFPPEFYSVINPDNGQTWETRTVTGADGSSTTAVFLDYYNYNNPGSEDILVTVPIDLTQASSAGLEFDVAYAQFNDQFSDGMRVEMSLDCGFSFTEVIYEKAGTELATVPNQSAQWFPTQAGHWRREAIDLTPFVGHSVVFRFIGINGFGNSLLLDNINVFQLSAPQAVINADNFEICEDLRITFDANASTGGGLTYSWTFQNGIPSAASGPGPHEIFYPADGTFEVTLTVNNALGESTVTEMVTILPTTEADFTVDLNAGIATFLNESINATSYLWDFGDGNTSTDENPVHTYGESGSYTVTLLVDGPCGDDSVSTTIDVVISSVVEVDGRFQASILPNPARHWLHVVLDAPSGTHPVQTALIDLTGKVVQQRSLQLTPGSQTLSFDVSALPAGLYFLKIQSGDAVKTVKVVVD